MKHFYKVAGNIDIKPLMTAIARQPELWNQNPYRTAYNNTAHVDVEDIWLRFNDVQKYLETTDSEKRVVTRVLNDLDVIDYPAMSALHQARPLIFDLMRMNEGYRLGRVVIAKLPPGGKVTAHIDEGAYANYYDRFHVVLKCPETGFDFRASDEHAPMKTGECWWFNNQVEHEVINGGDEDRVSMIIDIGCA